MGRLAVLALVVVTLWGCSARSESAVTPIPGWARPLCAPGAVAVTSPWDAEVQHLFARLLVAAETAVHRRSPVVVVIEGADVPTGGVCGTPSRVTVTLAARFLRLASTWPREEREAMIAATLAHELAHLALHEGSTKPHAIKEQEADTRGVGYFERAGLDCRR
jgi:hypothetical protein